MNKSAPAGNDLRKQISLLPKYRLTIVPKDEESVRIELVMLNQVYLKENMERLTAGPNHKFYLIVGDSENNLLYYSIFKDTDFLSVYDGCITCDVTRKQNNEHKLMAHCISSKFVGIDDNSEFAFKDLNPCTEKNNKFNCTPRVLKQSNITDIFSRKRKSPKQDMTQSKEKKKRDTDVIKQFKILRESVEITSKNITEDLNKKAELTTMILNDVNVCLEPQNKSQINDNNFNDTTDLSDPEAHVDDVKITNILNDIESEIENKNTNTVTKKIGNTHKQDPNIQNRHVSFNINKYKRKEPKNNFSFIKSLKQKYCQNEPVVTESDAGFSSAIKDHLNQFIYNIQHKNKNKLDMDILLENDCKHSTPPSGAPPENVGNNIDKNIIKDHTLPQKGMSISKQTPSESQLRQDTMERNHNILNEMDLLQKDKTKDHTTTELPMSVTHNHKNTIVQINNENKRIFTLTKSSNVDKHVQLNSFLPFEYCHVNSTKNDFNNMHEEHAKSNINNSIGYNNFLLPIEAALTQTSQKRDISLIQHNSIPVQNEISNYRILEIVEPKFGDILKNRENIKYSDMEDKDVNQYFFSATQINSCKKVLPEREIHIVGRLKVDFNVTEIKTKHDISNPDFSEYNTSKSDANNQNIEVAEFTGTHLDGMTVCSNTLGTPKQFNNEVKMVCNELSEINAEKENVAANSQVTVNGKQKNDVDVKDILNKYQRKHHVSKNQSQSFNESANETANIQNIMLDKSKMVEIKPKRRYKIRDFDKINIPLPEELASLITESKIRSQTCTNYSFHNTTSDKISETKNTQPLDIKEKENEVYLTPTTTKESFKYTINDDLTDSPQLPTDVDIQNDYDLSQAMLNPKTLLQAVNDETMVPPPPEFTDTYSPTYDKNDFNFNAYYDLKPDDAISEEKAAIDYEPNSERPIEEWTLSRDNLINYTPSENNSQNLSLSESLSQRQTKLSKFKFRKNEYYKFKN